MTQYLPRAWQELFGYRVSLPPGVRPARLDPSVSHHSPDGDVILGATAAGFPGPVGVTDERAAIEGRGIGAAVLMCGTGRFVPAGNNPHQSVALCSAINDWTIDRWLNDPQNRLWGSIVVPTQLPEKAAAEVRRVGMNPRMVQIQLTGNGLAKPFGHPLYHPIYKAAADVGLPVAIYAFADAPPDTLSQSAAIGPPATFTEFKVLSAQALMTHSISLIAEGVFEMLPDLRVLLVGAGVGWIPAMLWRADAQHEAWGRALPWIRHKPSEYFCKFFRVSTYQIEADAPRHVAAVFDAIGGFNDMLCYGSGYPSSDSMDLVGLSRSLPEEFVRNVVHDNPLRLYQSRIAPEQVA